MKADHRKQLEKNELADRLTRWWKGTRETKQSSAFWLVLGVIALVAVLVFAWRYYSDAAHRNRAAVWKQFQQAGSAEDLESIADANRGTAPGRAAKTQLARIRLNEGLRNMASSLMRTKGIEDVEKARALYDELAGDARNDDLTRREALLGAAKAEESLVGVPKADNAAESRGRLERAIELYEQVAREFKDTPQAQEADERLKEIRENPDRVRKFYEDLNKRFVRSETPFAPPEPKPSGVAPPAFGPATQTVPPRPDEPKPKTPLAPPPGDKKPEPPKPADTKPLVPPPADTKPKDTRPADPKPGEPKPAPPLTPPPSKDVAQPAPKADAPKPGDRPKK